MDVKIGCYRVAINPPERRIYTPVTSRIDIRFVAGFNGMETIRLNDVVHVIGFRVETFPLGVGDAFDNLVDKLGSDRPYYGLSRMSAGGVEYIAAALKKSPNENGIHKLQEYTIPKGEYAVRLIRDWQRNLNAIPHVFGELLKTKGIDDTAPCVEWYKNDDEMLCMVKLAIP